MGELKEIELKIKSKIKYIIKKILFIFIVAFISIFIYQLFNEIKNGEYVKDEILGTKISAKENEDIIYKEDLSITIEEASNCIVGVSKIKDNGNSVFLMNSAEKLGMGTGIIVSKSGYILTNQHVSGNEKNICYVTMNDGTVYEAKVKWSDSDIDLAVIKVNETFKTCAKLGDANNIKVGQTVYAIGNPIGYEFQGTVTSGIVSALSRTVKIQNEDESYSYMSDLIQTDATINPGNSGGPLININGDVIGINSVKITSADGIGFAIPINIAKPIIEKFNKEGKFDEAYLGIFAYDDSLIPYIDKNINLKGGIYVETISLDGPAYTSKLRRGDIITKIDNTKINKMSQLQEYVYSKKPNDEIILTVVRGNNEKQIKITLGKR